MRNHYHLVLETPNAKRMEGKVGENHPGQTRLETAQAKAEQIVAEELARLTRFSKMNFL
jgi:hypothetical protein